MLIFIGLVVVGAWPLYPELRSAFDANIIINGLILGFLCFGVLLNFWQVLSVRPSIRWVIAYSEAVDPDRARLPRPPGLIGGVAQLLRGASIASSFNPNTSRAILDSVATRIDESRDFSNYVSGLLVFLGLLGTFWGLLETINAVSDTIGALNTASGAPEAAISSLVAGLQKPLSGMGTAFSSSLFGLSGSLITGFLGLQSGRALNRFYNNLEEWVGTHTRVGAGAISGDESGSPAYIGALLERSAEGIAELQKVIERTEASRGQADRAMVGLEERVRGIDVALARLGEELPRGRDAMVQELRGELRTLSKTIIALAEKKGR